MTGWLGVAAVVVLLIGGLFAGALEAQPAGDAAKGEAVYKARCVTCHGPAGAGDGPAGKALKDKPSDWTKGEGGLKGLSNQQIFDSIKKGGPAIGKSPLMIASPALSDADIQNVIAYIKTLAKA
jgi:mono/diheme cytochrome c family protein